MTKRELIEALEGYDDDAPVHFAYNYGDYWKTQVAPEVGEVDWLPVFENARLDMPEVGEDEDDEAKCVIVLSAR